MVKMLQKPGRGRKKEGLEKNQKTNKQEGLLFGTQQCLQSGTQEEERVIILTKLYKNLQLRNVTKGTLI